MEVCHGSHGVCRTRGHQEEAVVTRPAGMRGVVGRCGLLSRRVFVEDPVSSRQLRLLAQ